MKPMELYAVEILTTKNKQYECRRLSSGKDCIGSRIWITTSNPEAGELRDYFLLGGRKCRVVTFVEKEKGK